MSYSSAVNNPAWAKHNRLNDKAEISAVIPIYNESESILSTLEKIEDHLSSHFSSHEIIVVDDGSTDDSVQKIRQSFKPKGSLIILVNGKNMGKGFSVKRGVLASTGRFVFFSDADLSTPVSELDNMMLHIKHFPVVIGSRALKGSDVRVHQPFYRETMGRIFNKIVRLFTVRGIKDTQCGFKLFNGNVARELFAECIINGFCFDVEALFIASKKYYPIKEVPVVWCNDPTSKVSPVKDSLKMLFDLFRIRFMHVKVKKGMAFKE